ncbi:hypothetical protein SAY86_016171 [Trapa natans]|uniref:Transmembrane protein n=1 Tax=Trapa natans TaxID=22666 RepID=A0AAN7LD72_TRANT|nr:hypothetical protein SAY86_016171 [Trapa natans]
MTHNNKKEKRGRRRRRRDGGGGSSFGFFKCFGLTVDNDEAVYHKAEVDKGPANKKGRRGLSCAIKSLLFQTFPGKKSRKSKRSLESDASASFGCPSDLSDSTVGSRSVTDSNLFCSSLSLDSSLRSSPLSSSSWNPSRSGVIVPTQRQHVHKGRRRRSKRGICAVIVTLLAVVLWGKFCAIICTSTLLYATSNHRTIVYPITNKTEFSLMDPSSTRTDIGD